MRRDGGKVMREVTVNGTRKRGNESVADLQNAEVNLHAHTEIEELDVERGREFFHVLARTGNEKTFMLNAEVTLPLLRNIARVGDKETPKLLIHSAEDTSIVRVPRRETNGKHSPLGIARKVKFQAVECTLARLAPLRKSSHGAMMSHVLVEAHRNISGIGELNEVRVFGEVS